MILKFGTVLAEVTIMPMCLVPGLVLNKNVPIVGEEKLQSIEGPSEERQILRKMICATTRLKQRGATPEIISCDILPVKEHQRNDPILKSIIEAKEKNHKPNWEDNVGLDNV